MDSIKKRLCLIIFAVLLLTLGGCGTVKNDSDDKIKVVCTIFPAYDWARQLVGDSDNVEVTLLVDNGVDLHSYQPIADDIITIADCDLFVYVGGESDTWVSDVVRESGNSTMKLVNMMELLGDYVREEEIVEGMQNSHHEDEDDSDHEEEYDEHVWLSLTNAAVCCRELAESLGELDAENAEMYQTNCDDYIEKLDDLDKSYGEAVSECEFDTILMGDRFPFRYMVDDYGIKYYAAYVGCSAETEASFDTIKFLSDKVDELGLPVILITESSDGSLAKTIDESSKNPGRDILVLDSMQAVTREDIDKGTTYLSVMEENLNVLKNAMKCSE